MKRFIRTFSFLAVTVVLVALAFAALFVTLNKIQLFGKERKLTYQALVKIESLRTDLVEAETGQRGFLLFHDESYLEPYQRVHEGIPGKLDDLDRITTLASARQDLMALKPLITAKMQDLANTVVIARAKDLPAIQEHLRQGNGKSLMDAIRIKMDDYTSKQNSELSQSDADFQSVLRQLFILMIIICSLVTALAALTVFTILRKSRQRLKNAELRATLRLLEIQEATSTQLLEINSNLQVSEEKQAVMLSSIGDGLIATDLNGLVTLINPVATVLTGWTQSEAAGRSIEEVFYLINKDSRLPVTSPVRETLLTGIGQGLANHTVLISRQQDEYDIADSCAPIRDREGKIIGTILVFHDATQEYATQQALRDSSSLVQTILNTVVDGIVTLHAQDGGVEILNAAAEQMFGYSGDELKGQNLSLLIPELDQNQYNGSLEYYSASSEARAKGLGREVLGRRKNGDLIPLEIAVSEMWLGGNRYFTVLLRDISARKQAEAALLKAGALQNAIIHSTNFSSIATDAKGVIQLFNVGAERMLGYAAGDVMNKITPADITDPKDLIIRARALNHELLTSITPGFDALVFKASRGMEDIYDLTFIRKDGGRFPAMVSVTALRDELENIIGYLLIGIDNTARLRGEAERVKFEQELQLKNAELEGAKFLAEKANYAKSDFLSSMSHELRTPLSAILGFAQLIESGDPLPTAGQKRSVEQILKAGWFLLELINEILDLSLIESGRLSLSLQPVNLAEVLDECQSMMEVQALSRGLDLSFPAFELPVFVYADRTRLKQVIINLLSNAVKYNLPGGSVTVVCPVAETDVIRLSVQDTGIGLSGEQIKDLFQPFNRLGQEQNDEEGTGIGLVVCKHLIELMGGEIGMQSTVGQGSTFWVELNLIAKPEVFGHGHEGLPATPVHVPVGSPVSTVLYVEDNPANMMLVEELIARRPDLHLLIARDGERGIELARSELPDLILMDVNLPGISGLGALKVLAKDPLTARIPVIALSANAIPRDIEIGLAAGFACYITKPIVVNEFMTTLDSTLARAKVQS